MSKANLTHTHEERVLAPVAPVAPEEWNEGNVYLCIFIRSEKTMVVRRKKQAPHEKI
jgi:hypothetical protein